MAVPAFRIEKTKEPNIYSVSGMTLRMARAVFGNKLLGPKQVHQLAQFDPFCAGARFGNAIDLKDAPTNMGIAVSKKEPLGTFLSNGNIVIAAKDSGEERLLTIPESKLVKAGQEMREPNIMKRENVILLINGGYTIDQSGNAHTIVLDEKSLDELHLYIRLFNRPQADGWYDEIEGMPVGAASSMFLKPALYCILESDLGSVVRRSPYEENPHSSGVYDTMRTVAIGSFLDVPRVVLVQVCQELGDLAVDIKHKLGDKLSGVTLNFLDEIIVKVFERDSDRRIRLF